MCTEIKYLINLMRNIKLVEEVLGYACIQYLHWCREPERDVSATRSADTSHRDGFMRCPQDKYSTDAKRQLSESQVIIRPSRSKGKLYPALGLEMPYVEEKGVENPMYLYSSYEDRWLSWLWEECSSSLSPQSDLLEYLILGKRSRTSIFIFSPVIRFFSIDLPITKWHIRDFPTFPVSALGSALCHGASILPLYCDRTKGVWRCTGTLFACSDVRLTVLFSFTELLRVPASEIKLMEVLQCWQVGRGALLQSCCYWNNQSSDVQWCLPSARSEIASRRWLSLVMCFSRNRTSTCFSWLMALSVLPYQVSSITISWNGRQISSQCSCVNETRDWMRACSPYAGPHHPTFTEP